MEGYIGEIRLFSGNFPPLNWAFCQGQLRSIADETALFSIVGVTYGGDGVQTFSLPDLRGRVAMGSHQGPGLSNRFLGQVLGTEGVTLNASTMPAHTHFAMVTPGQGPTSATATLNGVNGVGGQQNPGGNLLGQDTDAGATPYLNSGNAAVNMKADSIVVNSLSAPMPTITLSVAGANNAHTNLQPILAVNFIICVEGIYPSRS